MEKYKQLIKDEIDYEGGKDVSVKGKDWTDDCKEGFIDGLKRALELLEDNESN